MPKTISSRRVRTPLRLVRADSFRGSNGVVSMPRDGRALHERVLPISARKSGQGRADLTTSLSGARGERLGETQARGAAPERGIWVRRIGDQCFYYAIRSDGNTLSGLWSVAEDETADDVIARLSDALEREDPVLRGLSLVQ